MSNKKKKKSKNSDYRYLQKKEDAWREAQEKKERDANKTKNRIMNIGALVLIVISLIAAIHAYTNNLYHWAPFYTTTSAFAVMLMAASTKDRRPKFYKVGMGMGVALLLLAYYIARSTGLIGK